MYEEEGETKAGKSVLQEVKSNPRPQMMKEFVQEQAGATLGVERHKSAQCQVACCRCSAMNWISNQWVTPRKALSCCCHPRVRQLIRERLSSCPWSSSWQTGRQLRSKRTESGASWTKAFGQKGSFGSYIYICKTVVSISQATHQTRLVDMLLWKCLREFCSFNGSCSTIPSGHGHQRTE